MWRFPLFLLLVLCGLSAAAETKLKVVSSFSILDDFVGEIGSDKVERSVIVGPDADVHTYQPQPTDAREISTAQVLVTRAWRLTPAAILAPFDYVSIVLAVAFGHFWFHEQASRTVWLGLPLVIGSGLYILHRERVRAREARH